MISIKVNNILQSAFSNEQAEILREEIQKYIDDNDRIELDFSGITKYTTLFFNFSTGYYVNLLGKEKYDSIFEIKNLNDLGESTYLHSYNNSVKNDLHRSKEMEEQIWDIINSSDEV